MNFCQGVDNIFIPFDDLAVFHPRAGSIGTRSSRSRVSTKPRRDVATDAAACR